MPEQRATARLTRAARQARFLALLLFASAACASRPSLVPGSLSVELCSSILPLPDTTPNGAARKTFEEKMVQVGLLKRLGEVTLNDRRRATVYDVNISRASSLSYIRGRSASQPAIVQYCYGTIQPTRIIKLVKRNTSLYSVEFDYYACFKPWARSLYPFLRLRPHGVATDLLTAEPSLAHAVLARGELGGLPARSIEWPPDGKVWYGPGQFPLRVHWPDFNTLQHAIGARGPAVC